ncbi:MAG TPA: hypothetical protein ENK44_09335 [Caldithrix abyssi]|uniref:Glycogen debranching protein n=1 Tax=Caldithrix abyssi TaxID=187145 RepID=A0A7V4WVH7_CALAY|nr:hypothetical protein [Caldithrix abyssi]
MPEFNRKILSEIQTAQNYEWLEQNQLGAYASSSILGMNTRREHGLYVVPHKEAGKKVVLLAKLEESVFIDNQLYELSVNRYTDHIFPQGYQYLEEMRTDPFPHFEFKVDDRIIHKTLFIQNDRNYLYIRYELKNQGKPVKLVIKPFIACRYSDFLADEIQGYNTDSYLGQNLVRWAPRPDMPELNVCYNKGDFTAATLWYHGFYYPQSDDRYKYNSEDLLNPGFFEVTLNPYENLDMMFSTDDLNDFDLDYEAAYRKERELRQQSEQIAKENKAFPFYFGTELKGAVQADNEIPVVTSIMENSPEMRGTLLSLPGLLLSEKNYSAFKTIYTKIGGLLREGLLPINWEADEDQRRYGMADLSLWYIYIGYLYLKESGDTEFFTNGVSAYFNEIYDRYSKGTSYNIYEDKDGLIFCGDKTTRSSWIPLYAKNGESLRYGKLLEVNALWYNALRILAYINESLGKKRLKSRFEKHAKQVRESFNSVFINETDSAFYDFVRHEDKNNAFRFVQIIPFVLPYFIVEDHLGKNIFERIDRELVTPYGLRAASLKNTGQSDMINLARSSTDSYSKAIWPWTIMFYLQAGYNNNYNSSHAEQTLSHFFEPILKLRKRGLLGYIAEAVFVDSHVTEAGIRDYIPALAALKWSAYLIEKWKKEKSRKNKSQRSS